MDFIIIDHAAIGLVPNSMQFLIRCGRNIRPETGPHIRETDNPIRQDSSPDQSVIGRNGNMRFADTALLLSPYNKKI